ncbi:NDR1/HIN1-like protein 6 [Rhodamnia argentea]|uniref:NDR1/HIN1-like protein 6 n=1 Tax=Rhodamnia argentea TaxID=178133 RepID=A0A8B8NWN1_9MYRT|nr:NDR1/HIN1-like protein 6 [Rhodamnia argentea]
MTDRVFSSTKPTAANGAGATANGSFPTTKGQLYGGAARSTYRPQPEKRSHRRGRCCRCCLWTTVAFLVLLFLIAVAAAVFYVLYRPHLPTFTVTSFKVSYINVTSSSSTVNSKFDLTVSARNPNSKLVYIYSPISVLVLGGDGDVPLGDATIPSFVHGKKNTTVLKASIGSNGKEVDSSSASSLKSGLKSKNGLALKIRLDTKVKVKIGGLKTPRLGIRVTCVGIRATAPAAGTPAATGNAKCKVDTRVRIWHWTL